MERHSLKIELREKKGSRDARRTRNKTGRIPAVLYGPGAEAVGLTLDVKELRKALSGKSGRNTLLELQGAPSVAGRLAILKEVQHDPISSQPTHADLLELRLDKRIHVQVPIHLTGKAKGTIEGGIVAATLRELTIDCLPNDIPEALEIDITALDIGDSYHVRDIKLPAGVKAVGDIGASVVVIVPPAAEVVEVAAAPTTAEPEVLTAKADKAEGGAAAAAPAAGAKAPAAGGKEKTK